MSRDFIERPDILTHSGQYFDFTNPDRYVLRVKDIAHGLANACRFAGQCKEFYSVAQHSIYVSRLVPECDAFVGLMHDCAEAFLGDVTRPLKKMLADYREIEKRVEASLFAKLGISLPMPASVKEADLIMLKTEQIKLMPGHDDEWGAITDVKPSKVIIVSPLSPEESYFAFMERYRELTRHQVRHE